MIRTVVVGAAGRMGRMLVANILASDDLTLAGAIDWSGSPDLGKDAGLLAGCAECGIPVTASLKDVLKNADAVIDFSTGDVVADAAAAVAAGCSIVIGTTALDSEGKTRLAELARNGRIVFASNMSIGVNLLFSMVGKIAATLGDDYNIEIIEMHHNQKKDAPSGTAVTLAERICEATGRDYDKDVAHGRQGMVGARTKREIGMHAVRGGDVVGDHTVIYAVNGERIELTHKASSRNTFAVGALRAVRFLGNARPGLYDMQDVLGLKN